MNTPLITASYESGERSKGEKRGKEKKRESIFFKNQFAYFHLIRTEFRKMNLIFQLRKIMGFATSVNPRATNPSAAHHLPTCPEKDTKVS